MSHVRGRQTRGWWLRPEGREAAGWLTVPPLSDKEQKPLSEAALQIPMRATATGPFLRLQLQFLAARLSAMGTDRELTVNVMAIKNSIVTMSLHH